MHKVSGDSTFGTHHFLGFVGSNCCALRCQLFDAEEAGSVSSSKRGWFAARRPRAANQDRQRRHQNAVGAELYIQTGLLRERTGCNSRLDLTASRRLSFSNF